MSFYTAVAKHCTYHACESLCLVLPLFLAPECAIAVYTYHAICINHAEPVADLQWVLQGFLHGSA